MNNIFFPLPGAVQGKEYVIHSVKNESNITDTLRGYGIFPGATIKRLFDSPTKNPSAYEVMGAVLALRREDSSNIYISTDTVENK